jgi:hypothetical protein
MCFYRIELLQASFHKHDLIIKVFDAKYYTVKS